MQQMHQAKGQKKKLIFQYIFIYTHRHTHTNNLNTLKFVQIKKEHGILHIKLDDISQN